MLGFAGWNFFGAGSWQLMTQGVNLLMNVFFGVSANAARGITNQVDSAVLQFSQNSLKSSFFFIFFFYFYIYLYVLQIISLLFDLVFNFAIFV